MFPMRLFRRKPKYPFTKAELDSLFSHLPNQLVTFVYESFFMGALVTLSHAGTPEFNEVLVAYSAFLEKVGQITARDKEEEKQLRDALIRQELQSLLDRAKKPDA